MHSIRTFLLGVFCLSVSNLYSQHTILGKVVNIENQPIEGVSIFLLNTKFNAVSDVNGLFELNDIPEGSYIFKCSHVGFDSYELQMELNADREMLMTLHESSYYLNEINITTNRISDEASFVSKLLSKEELEDNNLGQDVPYLLQWTPSSVVTSDAGTGIGYTGIRIRGSDATRVNVTINGVPLNDSESSSVYWVNLPDITSSAADIQVQRGVGVSTHGTGAFGGTVSLNTEKIYTKSGIEINSSIGSFNTGKFNVLFNSGLINNSFAIDGRYSVIKSDGFVDRASSDLKSFYFSINQLFPNSSLRFITFGGKEKTYQAWNGAPESIDYNNPAMLLQHYDRNALYSYPRKTDSLNLFNSGREYNYYLYENQIDNYRQNHYQLHYLLSISESFTLKSTIHYTKGKGYFEEFRYNDDYQTYDLPITNEMGNEIESRDSLIRRKWLDNDFYGIILTSEYSRNNTKLQMGFSTSIYDGDHFGRVIYAQGLIPSIYRKEYYKNYGRKSDISSYIKLNQKVGNFLIYGDIQYRYVRHEIKGLSDVIINQNRLAFDVDRNFSFWNPKAGISYIPNEKNNIYASVAIGNKEPSRTDMVVQRSVLSNREQLLDFEMGWRHTVKNLKIELNQFYMKYKDQLVLTGALDDVGNSLRQNVANSYRIGTELSVSANLQSKWLFNIDCIISENRIKKFEEIIGSLNIQHENSSISYSPSLVGNMGVQYAFMHNFYIGLLTKYVGKQYLDNTSDEDRSLDPYSYTNVNIRYQIKSKGFRAINLRLLVNNIFNSKYTSNGYTYSYLTEEVITENFVYPQAGIHFLLGMQVKI